MRAAHVEEDEEPAGPAVVPDINPFAHEPPFRPRRNPARRWTMVAVAGAVALIALNIGLVTMGGIDGIAARLGGQPVISDPARSEEHTSELQSLMRISYAVFRL